MIQFGAGVSHVMQACVMAKNRQDDFLPPSIVEQSVCQGRTPDSVRDGRVLPAFMLCDEIGLEFWIDFAEIMPEAEKESDFARIEGFSKITSLACNLEQMLIKIVPAC